METGNNKVSLSLQSSFVECPLNKQNKKKKKGKHKLHCMFGFCGLCVKFWDWKLSLLLRESELANPRISKKRQSSYYSYILVYLMLDLVLSFKSKSFKLFRKNNPVFVQKWYLTILAAYLKISCHWLQETT